MQEFQAQVAFRFFRADPRRIAAVGGVVLWEALLWIVVAMLIATIPGAYAETPSAWAILGLIGAGFIVSYRLSGTEIAAPWRWLLGIVTTVLVLQVTARLDLSESLRIWDVGWVSDLFDPDSPAWHRSGHLDHFVSSVAMLIVWFRGVRLGTLELDHRPMLLTALAAFPLFGLAFAVGDNTGLIDTVRVAALLFLTAGLGVMAFRTALRVQVGHEGGFAAAGLSFLSTLGVMAGGGYDLRVADHRVARRSRWSRHRGSGGGCAGDALAYRPHADCLSARGRNLAGA